MREMKDSGVPWIGDIPKDWTIRQANQVFAATKHPNNGLQENNLLSLSYGRIVRKSIETSFGLLPESFEGYNIIDKDTIVLRLTDLQNDQKSLRVGIASEKGIITSAYLSLRCITDDTPKYLYYLLHCFDIVKGFYGMGGGIRQGLTWDGVKNLRFYLPNQAEQQRIADFLDAKCAEIDTILDNTLTSIEEYKKLKQSVITEAVTKGIHGERPMKDSGVKWIGEIPAEWEMSTLGRISCSVRNGYVGPTRDLFVEDGIRYIQSLHIKEGMIDFSRQEYYVPQEWASKRPKIKTNNLLIVQTGDIGQVALVTDEYDGCNCHALIIVDINESLVLPLYLTYYLRSHVGKELLLQTKTGALLPHLNSGRVVFTEVCLPSVAEQQEIAAYLDEKCSDIDSLIASKEALITELESYKKSIIYEYVTGKKEVL